jgi:hypothetical protein
MKRLALFGTAILLGACSRASPEAAPSDAPAVRPERTLAAAVAQRAAFRRHELASRWARSFAVPHGLERRACPSEVLQAPASKRVVVLARDARVEPRDLLPLRLTERLASPELAVLQADVSASEPTDRVLSKLDELSLRRFAGVFHVLDYQAPRRIRRIDRPRPEWVAGILVAQFAVYDLDRHEPLCQAHIVVRNDVRDAPLSRRLEAQVRERLTRALADELKQEARRALGDLGAGLLVRSDELHQPTAAM